MTAISEAPFEVGVLVEFQCFLITNLIHKSLKFIFNLRDL